MQNLCSRDFFKKCTYNSDTQTQIWCSQIADSHDNICCCNWPFAHLLASLFPPGHPDRQLTINQILERDYKQLCHSGGAAEKSHGMEDLGGEENIKQPKEEENPEEDFEPEEIEEMLIAAIKEGAR